MKLIDYIKGTRRGREANAVERRAMEDPFLEDAIDGYDAVYGNHSDKISELEDKIAKYASRKRKVRSIPDTLPLDACAVADNEMPEPATHAGRACESATPAAEFHDPAIAANEANGLHGAPDTEKNPERERYMEGTILPSGSRMRKTARKAGRAEIADVWRRDPDSAEITEGGRPQPVRSRPWLIWSAAAALLIAAGVAWYVHFEVPAVNMRRAVAMRLENNSLTDNVIQSFGSHAQERDASLAHKPEDNAAEEEALSMEMSRQIDEAVWINTASQRQFGVDGSVESETGIIEDVLSGVHNDAKITATFKFPEAGDDVSIAELFVAEQNEAIDENPMAAFAPRPDEDRHRGRMASNSDESDYGEPAAVAGRPSRPWNEAAGVTQSQYDITEMVANDEFTKYFLENSKQFVNSEGERTVGVAVVEFRVNDRGIPSAIQIITGISVEANHEIITLLTNGPRWAPTKGRRVRMEIIYE